MKEANSLSAAVVGDVFLGIILLKRKQIRLSSEVAQQQGESALLLFLVSLPPLERHRLLRVR